MNILAHMILFFFPTFLAQRKIYYFLYIVILEWDELSSAITILHSRVPNTKGRRSSKLRNFSPLVSPPRPLFFALLFFLSFAAHKSATNLKECYFYTNEGYFTQLYALPGVLLCFPNIFKILIYRNVKFFSWFFIIKNGDRGIVLDSSTVLSIHVLMLPYCCCCRRTALLFTFYNNCGRMFALWVYFALGLDECWWGFRHRNAEYSIFRVYDERSWLNYKPLN